MSTAKKRAAIYLRVSTSDQNTERQWLELSQVAEQREWSCDIYEDKLSGNNTDRPQFQKMMDAVVQGKYAVVACHELSRLGRSLIDLVQTAETLKNCNTDLYLHKQAMDTSTSSGKLFFSLMASLAEFERDLLSERIKSGMARRKAKDGNTGGRKVDKQTIAKVQELRKNHGYGIRKCAELAGVGNGTAEKIIKAMEAEERQDG